ncbi:TlpA disulfide reductase family protein [Robertmurraya korlensis]|jgi:thiol-disulfide isomerase/thioredoxin|uniref:TlpA disulfide reductase family protein n=1 Tax=Robertmurraya korlensis TaxID=519977 RepID=UPI000826D200|nr:TlpA disulfide reductase family protein [Robertmurraya korlensis]
MKKFFIIISLIVVLLFVVDKFLLQEKGLISKVDENKYEVIKDADSLPVGIKLENQSPNFQVMDLNGNIANLSDYRGKKVLLNFWASWCPPCKAEMPHMEELYKEHVDEGIVILALNMTNTENSLEDVRNFVEDQKLTFPILLDEEGEVSAKYEILAYPTSYFIDSTGVIRNKVTGALDKENLYKELMRLP